MSSATGSGIAELSSWDRSNVTSTSHVPPDQFVHDDGGVGEVLNSASLAPGKPLLRFGADEED